MSAEWLSTNGFHLVSLLNLNAEGRMALAPWSKCEGAIKPLSVPSLYIFLDRKADSVLYVGKAGKGWAARRPQHNGGYERARRGLTSAAHQGRINHLRSLVSLGTAIAIFERAVPSLSVIDEEERALITMFQPPMNVKDKA